jgi:hypothetical protein
MHKWIKLDIFSYNVYPTYIHTLHHVLMLYDYLITSEAISSRPLIWRFFSFLGHYGIKFLILTVKPVYKGHYGIKLLILTVKPVYKGHSREHNILCFICCEYK